MKVTINFYDEELESALQLSLDGSGTVQNYIRAAMRYFNIMKMNEDRGKVCGFGEKERFKTYNTEISPKTFLNNED